MSLLERVDEVLLVPYPVRSPLKTPSLKDDVSDCRTNVSNVVTRKREGHWQAVGVRLPGLPDVME